jgi:hypothetical protein
VAPHINKRAVIYLKRRPSTTAAQIQKGRLREYNMIHLGKFVITIAAAGPHAGQVRFFRYIALHVVLQRSIFGWSGIFAVRNIDP